MSTLIKLEKALSARSTCRITGDKIEKGELRVGVDAWLGGRVATMWLKLLPFLEACHLEHCPNNRGTCKKTGEKFTKGDVRMVIGNKDHKVNLSLTAAGEELGPALEAAGDTFAVGNFKGLDELTKEELSAFCAAFHVEEKDLKVEPVAVKGGTEGDGKLTEDGVEKKAGQTGKGGAKAGAKAGAKPGGKVGSKAGVKAGAKAAKKKKQEEEEDDEEEEEEEAEAEEQDEGSEEARPTKRRRQNVVEATPRRTSARQGNKQHVAAKGGNGNGAAGGEANGNEAVKQEEKVEPAAGPRPLDEGGVKHELTASPPDEPMAEGPEEDGLTDYERQRQLQILRNQERLLALSIPSLIKEALPAPAPPKAPTIRGVTNKKVKAPSEPVVLRQSSRIRGMTAEAAYVGGIISENRDGSVVLASGMVQDPETRPRHVGGPLPFSSENGDSKSDAAFLELLRSTAVTIGERAGPDTGSKSKGYEKMQLAEKDVAKITKDGIAVIAFHPSHSTLFVAAGDKQGKLGLWHVDYESTGDDDSNYDGVLMFAPHQQYISGLKWLTQGGTADKLITASYDGSVRMLDLHAEQFLKVSGTPEDAEFSCSEVVEDSQLVLLGDPDGDFYVLDMRAGKAVHQGLSLHGRKINTLHLEPSNLRLLASAGTDAVVNVWDIRHVTGGGTKSVKPLSSGAHYKSCQAAYWSPDGSCRLLSTSFDDSLAVWHDPKWSLAREAAALGTGNA